MRIRSGYSFRAAYGHLPDVHDANPFAFAPLTDRASTFGFNRWTKLCKASGKRPVYGLELAVAPNIFAKKPTRSHFTFLATDRLEPLNALIKTATAQFRYESLLSYDQINQLDPSLIVFPGRQALLEKIDTEALGDRLAILHSPSTPAVQLQWAAEKGIRRVASSDNFYPYPEDREAYEVLCGRGANSQSFPMHILTADEMERLTGPEAMSNAELFAGRCTAELLPSTLLTPAKPLSLKTLCIDGAKGLGVDIDDPIYSERLRRELEIIAEKDFEDYFFIIADLVNASRKQMFVGPARGSSGGSLVCYLLGITTIDPIKFGLIFERFIDVTRSDLPDIDIDFSDQKRHLALRYLEDRYGKNHVARLGTVALYKSKSAINEASAALGVPKWRSANFATAVAERSNSNPQIVQTIADSFEHTQSGRDLLADFPEIGIAGLLERHPRHHSQHAAGVVVTQEPVERYVAIDTRTNATHCDKKDAEDLNLLKIDALGLTQLSVFEDCLAAIGKPHDWLIHYRLDDKKAFEILNDRRWAGIFQWNGSALQSLTKATDRITEFEDIVSITALARPGPLSSGGATNWVRRKNGTEPVKYLHPEFEKHLGQTLGIVIYQEQVMSIGRDIGGLSVADVTALRKAMSKSLGNDFFDQYGERFKAGARRLNLEPEVLDRFWNDLVEFGAWAFNRSHSVAYGFISYWCCVLKAHFPLEFAAASLTHEKDSDRQLKLLREIVAEGYPYQPVHPKLSTDRWQSGEGKLIGPLTNIQGLGPKTLQEILGCRKSGMPLSRKAESLLANPVTPIDELEPVKKRIEALHPDGLTELGIISDPVNLIDMQTNGRRQPFMALVKLAEIKPRDHNDPQAVARRDGRRMTGKTLFLSLVLEDDTDTMPARISRDDYERLAVPVIDRGDAGNALYAIKGSLLPDYRLVEIKKIKYLGSMKN